MESEFFASPGEVVTPDELSLRKALDTARLLDTRRSMPFATLVECRRYENELYQEIVIFDADVEVSQRPVNDIRHLERIAAVFTKNDVLPPDALALRKDFPTVSHLNIRPYEFPRSLCLSDQPFSETRLRWTARSFVEDVRTWLALTAAGTLHQGDQPLEPLMSGFASRIILPSDLFAAGAGTREHLYVYRVDAGSTKVLKASRNAQVIGGQKTPEFVAIAIESAPHTHGVIRWQPTNLKELHEFLSAVGTDLFGELRSRMRAWEGDPGYLKAYLILIVSLPKRRDDGGPVESRETWGFMTGATVEKVGTEIGIWGMVDGTRGLILDFGGERQAEEVNIGEQVGLDLLIPHFALSREFAAALNDLSERCTTKIVAMGLGALGSHAFNNLIRTGFGEWTTIDKDILLPHNLARHVLGGSAVGYAKANALAVDANDIIDGEPIAKEIVADVLDPGDAADAVANSFAEAEVLFDMSASIAVARHLARDREVPGRRISAFLNPMGTDLVILAEDATRSIRLDSLEMQYYRTLASDTQYAGHLRTNDGKVRYGHSCRDVSSRISQELVALHGAIASRAFRNALKEQGASIDIWRSDEYLAVQRHHFTPVPIIEERIGDWILCTDQFLQEKVRRQREEKLPCETGGVLIGSYDMERRIVYVVDTVLSPADSNEQPTIYIRGSQGLRSEVERINAATGGWLEYVGEWHSHPEGHSAQYSSTDKTLFEWLTEMMAMDGHPPLMLIVGEAEHRWYLDTLPKE